MKTDLDRPPIILKSSDRDRLDALLADCPPDFDGGRFLAEEVERAEIVEAAEIGPGVATMHSYVEFLDDVVGRVERVTLVYPGEEDHRLGRITVLSPVGAALLGLCEGQSICWRTATGGWRSLTLLKVLVQHWRAPPSSWTEIGRLAERSAPVSAEEVQR